MQWVLINEIVWYSNNTCIVLTRYIYCYRYHYCQRVRCRLKTWYIFSTTSIHTYIPNKEVRQEIAVPGVGTVYVDDQNVHITLVGGDQLTVARARGAQRIRSNSERKWIGWKVSCLLLRIGPQSFAF